MVSENEILNKIAKEMDISKKEITSLVLNELEIRGFMKRNFSTFKNIERILYEYPKLKDSISEREKEIKELKEYGLQEKSKSITGLFEGGIKKDKQEIIEESIVTLKAHIFKTKVIIKHIDSVLSKIKDDPYYDIIPLKYFQNLSYEQIAEHIDIKNNKKTSTATSTIATNKNRLIEELRPLILPNDLIGELLGY